MYTCINNFYHNVARGDFLFFSVIAYNGGYQTLPVFLILVYKAKDTMILLKVEY